MKHIAYICVLSLTATSIFASGTLFFPPKGIDFEELKKQRRGNKLLVGFTKIPTKKELIDIPGVTQVDAIDNTMCRIHFKEKYLPAEEIVALAVKNKWGLFHIAPDITSLEDIFVQLTQIKK